jgi:hypothetical protein
MPESAAGGDPLGRMPALPKILFLPASAYPSRSIARSCLSIWLAFFDRADFALAGFDLSDRDMRAGMRFSCH